VNAFHCNVTTPISRIYRGFFDGTPSPVGRVPLICRSSTTYACISSFFTPRGQRRMLDNRLFLREVSRCFFFPFPPPRVVVDPSIRAPSPRFPTICGALSKRRFWFVRPIEDVLPAANFCEEGVAAMKFRFSCPPSSIPARAATVRCLINLVADDCSSSYASFVPS